jgi:23S rRNA (uracil1939-C5)-methyltransferase
MDEVRIEKLDHYGRGIGYINNKIIFIDNALVGEVVNYEVILDKKDYLEGKVVNYISKSSDRVEAKCPYYNLCGGCDIMHMPYNKQLDFKLNKVKNILDKYAHINPALVKKIESANEFNYRNKIVLKVNEKAGYYKKNSYQIVEVDNCMIADPAINEVLSKLNSMDLTNIKEITIRKLDKVMIYLDLLSDINTSTFKDMFPKCNIVKRVENKYITVNGNNYINTSINNINFRVSATSFFQVNNEVTNKLYNKVLEYANLSGKETVLDLFCGTGTIGMFLANKALKVTGIDITKSSIEDAIINKELNYINNINFINGDVDDHLYNLKDIDLLIVDPPRSGLTKKTIKHIEIINPSKVIYVSCDPVTLARDIDLMTTYEVKEITLFDMFPNTHHVESVVLMERND